MICTFFGHRDAPAEIGNKIEFEIEKLIQEHSVTHFYIGNNGNFDNMALQAILKVKRKYNNINYEIVLAYMPTETVDYNTLFPEGIENIPKRFAICFRNKWMIKHSDYIIAYVDRTFGGAYQNVTYAQRQGKTVINLSK